jgi:hypothetical protein
MQKKDKTGASSDKFLRAADWEKNVIFLEKGGFGFRGGREGRFRVVFGPLP